MNYELELISDLSETLSYNQADFPLYANKIKLEHFDRFTAACHCHLDIEFVLMLEGNMDYYINGNIVTIHAVKAYLLIAIDFITDLQVSVKIVF